MTKKETATDRLWNNATHPLCALAKSADYSDDATKKDKIIAAANCIVYRFYNDGDHVWDRNAETASHYAAALRRMTRGEGGSDIRKTLDYMKGARVCGDNYYETWLERFADAVVEYVNEL